MNLNYTQCDVKESKTVVVPLFSGFAGPGVSSPKIWGSGFRVLNFWGLNF